MADGNPNKRCKYCKYYFLGYRRDGGKEFCTYPGITWRFALFSPRTPVYRDIDTIDVSKCKKYCFDILAYIMNLFLFRLLRSEPFR